MKNRKQEPKQEQVKKQELKQVKKNGSSAARTVTERHTVEWYMQHTIDALKEGVKYGEQKLREVYKQQRV